MFANTATRHRKVAADVANAAARLFIAFMENMRSSDRQRTEAVAA